MISEQLTEKTLAAFFDHTFLKAYAAQEDFDRLCEEAKDIGAAMVAINSSPVSYCHEKLKGTAVHVGAAISFPLGQTAVETKLFETEKAIQDGADEIDYVINIGEAIMHHWAYIEDEMRRMTALCHQHGILIKVIFENCYLTEEEIIALSKIAEKVRPDYIKTSTGFGTGGAVLSDVKLMLKYAGEQVKVKAAGGIRDWAACREMIEAGVSRIGTSSTLKILEEFRSWKEQQTCAR